MSLSISGLALRTGISLIPMQWLKDRRGRDIHTLITYLSRQNKLGPPSQQPIGNTVSKKFSQEDATMPTLADFRAWWINSGEDLSQTNRIHLRDKGWTDFTDWDRDT